MFSCFESLYIESGDMSLSKLVHTEMLLAGSRQGLIDIFSLTACLNSDIRMIRYKYPRRLIREQPPEEKKPVTPPSSGTKKRRTPPRSNGKEKPVVEEKRASPLQNETKKKKQRLSKGTGDLKAPRTIQDIGDAIEIEDNEAKRGFIDARTGEQLFLIEKIIRYEPPGRYLVHWQGYPKSERSWQEERDMPIGFAEDMALAKKKYEQDRFPPSTRTQVISASF